MTSVLPTPVLNLINAFERLPGIGPKSASRLAFYMLRVSDDVPQQLAEALLALKQSTGFCELCFHITLADRPRCDVCSDERRDPHSLCVVEEPLDVLALERTGGFEGRYHVLHGVLSPVEGIGPEDLKMAPLVKRVQDEGVREVILATNPSMEGDATAMYIARLLAPFDLRITRLARGLPVGGDLEYADQSTLLRALTGRQEMP